jgi:hypothetical protein
VSVNRSAGDQMLKYGSHVTSGTDGGRQGLAVGSEAAAARQAEAGTRTTMTKMRMV